MPDLVTPWTKAGRPAFDNGLNNPTTISAANNTYFVRNGTSQPVLVLGGAGSVPYQSWFSSGNITAQTTAYAANTTAQSWRSATRSPRARLGVLDSRRNCVRRVVLSSFGYTLQPVAVS